MRRSKQQQQRRAGRQQERSSPVSDGGWGWLVLAGSFCSTMVFSGSTDNVGVYVVEWQEYFAEGTTAVFVIVMILSFCANASTLFSGTLCRRWGCRHVMMIGGTINIISTFLVSFSTQLWHMYIFAVVSGISHGLCLVAAVVVIRFHFEKRIGLANGVAFSGMGAGFLVMSPLVEALCRQYGWKGAMLVHSAINANYLVCGALYRPTRLELQTMAMSKTQPEESLESREVPEASTRTSQSTCRSLCRKADDFLAFSRLMKNRLFAVLALTSIFTLSGYVSSVIFVPSRLVFDFEFSKTTASLIMSVFGLSSFLARVVHGVIIDLRWISAINLYLFALVLCGIYLFFSPLLTTPIGHFVLIVTYGLGSGTMVSLTFLLCRQYVPIDIASIGIGLILMTSGITMTLGLQLMGIIYDSRGSYDIGFYLYGACFWLGAVVMGFVTKCSRWKEAPNQDPEIPSADYTCVGQGEESRNEDTC